MSQKLIGERTVYSMTSIVKEFLHEDSKKEVQKFISFLIKCNILEKKVLRYTHRTAYSYSPSEWFAVKFEGHYFAGKKKYKGEEVNGTLYFDEFLAKVLSRLYRYEGQYKVSHIMDNYFSIILLDAALEYVPKIKQLEDKIEKKKEDKKEEKELFELDDETAKQRRQEMLNGITNVLKSAIEEKRKMKQKK